MNLSTTHFHFTLLTPCFSGTWEGKNAPQAEMRIPAIRGMIRYWHRQLFDNISANEVWGSAAGNEGTASKVAVQFLKTPTAVQTPNPKATLLPHKEEEHKRGPRASLQSNNTYELTLRRLPACTNEDWDKAQKAVRCWLLLGCLGLRSNRAAGSVWPTGDWVPSSEETLKATLNQLGYTKPVQLAGAGKNLSAAQLRETASDTVSGGNKNHPQFGGIKPRQPSPTKFKVARLGSECVLLITGSNLPQAYKDLTSKHDPHCWRDLGPWKSVLP